ncbi:hypothetical protein WA026_021917 [Henosepilachna vigintioctopunctata]|uniref:Uncharacterized protein n=1 Tax=Henosepilachna vigintioctopunctata TaxID=420089 RepID=A0AAW1VIH3_9CUCU
MIFPNIMVNNYTIADHFCRTKHKNGGSLILVKDSLHYKEIEYLGKYKEEITSEISAVEIPQEKLLVFSVYRSKKAHLEQFLDKIDGILENILLLDKYTEWINGYYVVIST